MSETDEGLNGEVGTTVVKLLAEKVARIRLIEPALMQADKLKQERDALSVQCGGLAEALGMKTTEEFHVAIAEDRFGLRAAVEALEAPTPDPAPADD